ncbi:Myb- protein B [Tritrichomonas musculus]|uniref:Myb- protein B n=1 Tax=Tritrichomonas musculus TaxID=1915356 RepID=A0ABR2H6W8_9EUKA
MDMGISYHHQIINHHEINSNGMINCNQIEENEFVPILQNSDSNGEIICPINMNQGYEYPNIQNFQTNNMENVNNYSMGLKSINANISNDSQLQNESKNNYLNMINNSFQENISTKFKLKADPNFIKSMLKLIDTYNISLNMLSQLVDNDNNKNVNKETNNNINKQKIDYSQQRKKMPRKFSTNEDLMLKNVVNIFGAKNWKLIASMIPNKTPRQCRDRYMNYLAPGYIHSDWTKEEDLLLADKYKEYGPQWSKIQKFFPFRTSNSIKNRFNYTISKMDNIFDSTSNIDGKYEKRRVKIKNKIKVENKPIDQNEQIEQIGQIEQKKQNEEYNEKYDENLSEIDNHLSDQDDTEPFFNYFETIGNDFHYNYFD